MTPTSSRFAARSTRSPPPPCATTCGASSRRPEHCIVVVDLEAVTFLDSSALGALVGVLRRLRERDGQLRIVQPRTAAARIFELTGLDAVLDLYPDRAAALSAASE